MESKGCRDTAAYGTGQWGLEERAGIQEGYDQGAG